MQSTPIGRLRMMGLAEGTSFLVLLLVAMPLKYLADMPLAVRIVGSVHGALFVLFCVLILLAMRRPGLSIGRAAVVFLASLVPFGTYAIDGWLRRIDAAIVREPR